MIQTMVLTGLRPLCAVLLAGVVTVNVHAAQHSGDAVIKAVVVTGGHGFDQKAFPALFAGHDDIDATITSPEKGDEVFESVDDWDYDVIVLYTMNRKIPPSRRENFLKLLERGIGVVALHHTFAAYPDWPEFREIIGVKYLQKPAEIEGERREASTYKHDVEFAISVENREHPVTKNIDDFTVYDETYHGCYFEPDNEVLLTTDHPTSDKPVAWVRTYRGAPVCTIQMGHGPQIFSHDAYRRLVAGAIRFCASGEKAK